MQHLPLGPPRGLVPTICAYRNDPAQRDLSIFNIPDNSRYIELSWVLLLLLAWRLHNLLSCKRILICEADVVFSFILTVLGLVAEAIVADGYE